MKNKKIVTMVTAVLLLFMSGCSGKAVKADSAENKDKETVSASGIKISSTKRQNTGMIEVSGDDVYYVLNWTSRSRKTLKVTGKLKEEIREKKGRIIEARGKITYESPWRGTIEIESYTVIE